VLLLDRLGDTGTSDSDEGLECGSYLGVGIPLVEGVGTISWLDLEDLGDIVSLLGSTGVVLGCS